MRPPEDTNIGRGRRRPVAKEAARSDYIYQAAIRSSRLYLVNNLGSKQAKRLLSIAMTCNGLHDAIIMEKSILWYGSGFIHEPDSRAVGDIWHNMTHWERRMAGRRAELEAAQKQRDRLVQPLDFEEARVPVITRIEEANPNCALHRHNLNIRTV
ncbi:hypothetical protein TWF481_003571 [Arthrobotrys musiformis]|uniref:Uncharacterized protein n=1 Tax=Arthrobotrys musiformis TaxID=47236 RepID=A0AAV9WIX8_9PEZI